MIVYDASFSISFSTHELKRSSHLFRKTHIAPDIYMRLEEIYYSILNVEKKVSSSQFWRIDYATLTDQLSGGKHKQHILMFVSSCTYIRVKNLRCIVLTGVTDLVWNSCLARISTGISNKNCFVYCDSDKCWAVSKHYFGENSPCPLF